MLYRFPNVDLFSFLIGLIAGALTWLLIHQLFKLVPKLLKTLKHNRELEILEKQPEIDAWLRQQLLKKCESAHFGASLFPLSAVYTDIPFQVPLSAIKHNTLYPDQNPGVYSLFPPIPQTPDIQQGFAYPTISLSDALTLNHQLVVLGEIGSGKTSLLSRFVSRVLTQDERTQRWNKHLPIYIHASELDFDLDIGDNLFVQIAKTIDRGGQSRNLDILSKLLLSYYDRSQLLLIVDGLDEFPTDIHKVVVDWLKNINERYFDLPIVTTSGPFYSGDLECSGFTGFFMSPFENHHRNQQLDQWLMCLSEKNPEIANNILFHRLQLEQSLTNQNRYLSIFETTLLIWDYFFGSSENPDLIESSLKYLIRHSNQSVSSNEAAQALFLNATISPANLITLDPDVLKDSRNSSFLADCVQSFALVDLKNNFYKPLHPALILYVSSICEAPAKNNEWVYPPTDPMICLSLRLGLISPLNQEKPQSPPNSSLINFLSFVPYFENLEDSSPWKQSFLAKAYQLIQDPANSLANKIQLLTFFSKLPAASLAQILVKLQQHSDSDCQLVSIYAHAVFDLPDRVHFLQTMLLSDKNEFRESALISLARIWNSEAQKICLDYFMKASERDKRILAELFAHKQIVGHDILKELTSVADAKCRRAAIHGLQLIKEPWVKSIFEDLSLHDFEWNVRDAAVHALETYDETVFSLADPYSDATNKPWLIQFASRHGIGIPADVFPTTVLHTVLSSGDISEQIAALVLLAQHPDPLTIKQISESAKSNRSLREHAQESLFQIYRGSTH